MEPSELFWMALLVVSASIKLAIIYAMILFGTIFGLLTSAVMFLFENWIFQAAFGAWVVFALQQIHQKSVQRADLFQKRYEQKLSAIQSFFGLVDKRIYASRAYLVTLRTPHPDEIWVAERERCREAVREWNEKAPSVLVTMLTLLPARMCYQIERDTFLPFSQVDQMLSSIRRARLSNTTFQDAVFSTQDKLAELATNSNVSLASFLNLAKQERRLIDHEPSISEENLPNLSFSYLVTSLFKTTID